VLEELPAVAIVFDRYHVIQLMNQRLDELRREMVREATGPLKLAIKGTRYLSNRWGSARSVPGILRGFWLTKQRHHPTPSRS
jgi:transposase